MKMTPENIRAATERAAATKKRTRRPTTTIRDSNSASARPARRPGACECAIQRGAFGGFGQQLSDLTPAAARKVARTLRVKIEAGHDPIAEQRATRSAGADVRAGIGTLRAIIDQYQLEGAPPKTWFTGAGRKRVERVFRDLLPKPVGTMRASDIMRSGPLSRIKAGSTECN